jgi:hypothetical protein
LLFRLARIVKNFDADAPSDEAKVEAGKIWLRLIDRRAQSRQPILVLHTLADGSVAPCSFASHAAFANYVKTMHPSLAEESDAEAIAWYSKKFASVEVKEDRELMDL